LELSGTYSWDLDEVGKLDEIDFDGRDELERVAHIHILQGLEIGRL
jgi:hypothetical protein